MSRPVSSPFDLQTPSPHPQRTLRKAAVAAVVASALLLSGAGWRYAANRSAAENLRRQTAESLKRSVIAVRPKPGETSRKLVLPASLKGYSETQLFARTNGYLKAWYKTIGDTVGKGDLLAEIDVPELEHDLAQGRAALAQVRARRELARSTWERWNRLSLTDGAPRQEVDEKQAAFLQADADLAAAAANVKRLENIENYRRVVAPFDGVITRRTVDVGSLIGTGSQELFALTQTDPLRLSVWVPQAYAEEIKAGQSVSVRPLDAQGKPLKARIEHVAGALDPSTRARQAEISLPNPEGKLLPGAYLEISIDIPVKASPLVVPANVLVMDKDGTHVVAVNGEDRIEIHPVKVGRDFGREVEILEGVEARDVLVASPSDLLAEGEAVTRVEAAETPKKTAAAKS